MSLKYLVRLLNNGSILSVICFWLSNAPCAGLLEPILPERLP